VKRYPSIMVTKMMGFAKGSTHPTRWPKAVATKSGDRMKLAHVVLLGVCVTIGFPTGRSTRFPNGPENAAQLTAFLLAKGYVG